jgi:hypothetical protein
MWTFLADRGGLGGTPHIFRTLLCRPHWFFNARRINWRWHSVWASITPSTWANLSSLAVDGTAEPALRLLLPIRMLSPHIRRLSALVQPFRSCFPLWGCVSAGFLHRRVYSHRRWAISTGISFFLVATFFYPSSISARNLVFPPICLYNSMPFISSGLGFPF